MKQLQSSILANARENSRIQSDSLLDDSRIRQSDLSATAAEIVDTHQNPQGAVVHRSVLCHTRIKRYDVLRVAHSQSFSKQTSRRRSSKSARIKRLMDKRDARWKIRPS